eukprot:c13701_g1_i2.p1 GENE.c13701_g1_i2~~c13701_g1_i2.p1  ORF type:complete len:956 (+),score=198.91 c13701_g1_i2:100-2868(+)
MDEFSLVQRSVDELRSLIEANHAQVFARQHAFERQAQALLGNMNIKMLQMQSDVEVLRSGLGTALTKISTLATNQDLAQQQLAQHQLLQQQLVQQQLMQQVTQRATEASPSPAPPQPTPRPSPVPPRKGPFAQTTAVVVFAFARPDYLQRTLNSILKHMPLSYTLFVSLDGNHQGVRRLMEQKFGSIELFLHPRDFTGAPPPDPNAEWELNKAYYAIANHYGFAFGKLITEMGFNNVIALEDDLEISPDFFAYFEKMATVMARDPSIWTVSAFNDNGQRKFVSDVQGVVRSDFFPGLGWLMTRKLWDELGPKWPHGFWDDWMREPEQRKGRVTLRPEVSRSRTFGVVGTSEGQFFDRLAEIVLCQEHVAWGKIDLSYLMKDVYDKWLTAELASAKVLPSTDQLIRPKELAQGTYLIKYPTLMKLSRICQMIGLMEDVKAGVPRGAYAGVISFRYRGSVAYIAHESGLIRDDMYKKLSDQAKAQEAEANRANLGFGFARGFGGNGVDQMNRWEPGPWMEDDWLARTSNSGAAPNEQPPKAGISGPKMEPKNSEAQANRKLPIPRRDPEPDGKDAPERSNNNNNNNSNKANEKPKQSDEAAKQQSNKPAAETNRGSDKPNAEQQASAPQKLQNQQGGQQDQSKQQQQREAKTAKQVKEQSTSKSAQAATERPPTKPPQQATGQTSQRESKPNTLTDRPAPEQRQTDQRENPLQQQQQQQSASTGPPPLAAPATDPKERSGAQEPQSKRTTRNQSEQTQPPPTQMPPPSTPPSPPLTNIPTLTAKTNTASSQPPIESPAPLQPPIQLPALRQPSIESPAPLQPPVQSPAPLQPPAASHPVISLDVSQTIPPIVAASPSPAAPPPPTVASQNTAPPPNQVLPELSDDDKVEAYLPSEQVARFEGAESGEQSNESEEEPIPENFHMD